MVANRGAKFTAFVALSFGLTVAATAADLPVKAPPYTPAPVRVFSWTGCYIGGNVGGLWASTKGTDQTPGSATFGQTADNIDVNDWLGGVQGGCDYQVKGWVFGVAGDYDWTDARGTAVDALAPGFTDSFRVKSLASVTGRVGYTWDRFLVYVKGGGAWQRIESVALVTASGATFTSGSKTLDGWTIGVGGEYAFTDWLSAFIEYDYYDFGNQLITTTCVTPGCGPGGTSNPIGGQSVTDNVFKAGLNLRYNFSR